MRVVRVGPPRRPPRAPAAVVHARRQRGAAHQAAQDGQHRAHARRVDGQREREAQAGRAVVAVAVRAGLDGFFGGEVGGETARGRVGEEGGEPGGGLQGEGDVGEDSIAVGGAGNDVERVDTAGRGGVGDEGGLVGGPGEDGEDGGDGEEEGGDEEEGNAEGLCHGGAGVGTGDAGGGRCGWGRGGARLSGEAWGVAVGII